MSKILLITKSSPEIRISFDEKLIAINDGDHLVLMCIESGKTIFTVKLDEDIESFEFTKDGKYLFYTDGIDLKSISINDNDLELVNFFKSKNIEIDEIERFIFLESNVKGDMIFYHPDGCIYLLNSEENCLKYVSRVNKKNVSINANYIDEMHNIICLTANLIWFPDRMYLLNFDEELSEVLQIEKWCEGKFLGSLNNGGYVISAEGKITVRNIHNLESLSCNLDVNVCTHAVNHSLHNLAVSKEGGIQIFNLDTCVNLKRVETGDLSPTYMSFLNRKDLDYDLITCFSDGRIVLLSTQP